jgi:DHA1 family tetracycline resistance protein-like MFS transporter
MRQSSLLIIFLIIFIDLVGFGIVIPILPYYAKAYNASAWDIGWLMAIYSLMQFLFSPVWGKISDFVGRRPVLLISLLGTSISMTLLGLAGSLTWLFIARAFAGICGANISTAYAYVTDVTSEKDRAKGMGLIGAGFGLGFIFGPAIGAVLSRYGFGFPMFVGAAMAFANFCFALFKLEEPELTDEIRAANRIKRFDFESNRMVLADSRVRLGVVLFFLVTFAVAQMETVFAIHMGAIYNYDAEHAGFLLAMVGLIMVIIQAGFIRKLVPKYGELKLIIFGCLVSALALTAYASITTIYAVIISLMVLAVGHGILHPTLSSFTSLGAPANLRGSTMGVFQSAGSLARVVGPPCAGWLYDRVTWRAPFFSGAIFLVAAFLLSLFWYSRHQTKRNH